MLGDSHREQRGGKRPDPDRPPGYWVFVAVLTLISLAVIAWLFFF